LVIHFAVDGVSLQKWIGWQRPDGIGRIGSILFFVAQVSARLEFRPVVGVVRVVHHVDVAHFVGSRQSFMQPMGKGRFILKCKCYGLFF
jgi:hypothetical protein